MTKNFYRCSSHGHHGSKHRELVQHAHLTWIARIHSHTYMKSTQLQPRGAKLQLSYYRIWNGILIIFPFAVAPLCFSWSATVVRASPRRTLDQQRQSLRLPTWRYRGWSFATWKSSRASSYQPLNAWYAISPCLIPTPSRLHRNNNVWITYRILRTTRRFVL